MEFLNPNVFYIMLVPLILLFILIITSKSGIHKYFSKEILEQLSVGNNYIGQNTRNIVYFVVLILFIISLSRPVIDKKEQNIQQNLIPIVIALDVSKSMLATDIYPNRILMAKKKLKNIIKKSKNTLIGVVLFAKDSFVLSPVTEDFLSLQYIVDNLDTNLNFANGSNIFSTLEATKYMLEDFTVKNLIILSDGGNNSEYKDELEYAEENDIVIYSIGMATKEGAPIPEENGYVTDTNGDIVRVKLNQSIKNLSLKSGGGYIDFSLDNNDIDAIIQRINIQSKKEELDMQKVKIYSELFYYPLALGLFLLLVSLSSFPNRRKKSKINSILLVSLVSFYALTPLHSLAYTFNFENIDKANEAYEKKEYKKASTIYKDVNANNQSLYNLANSLYKEGKYEDAIKTYNKVVTNDKDLEAKKLHNLGNSYVNTKNLKKAKEFYEKALKVKDDKDTKENLEIVKKELEKQDKKKKKDKKKDENKQDKNKDNKQQKKDKNKEDKNKDKQKKDENKQDKNNKENKDKSSKENKEKKSPEEKSKKDKKKDKKKDENEKKKTNQNNEIDQKQSNIIKKDEISQREEKKWMKLLQNQKTPIYLQKVKTKKESSYDEKQPW
jgi:Ca-activated chloride channel family protein